MREMRMRPSGRPVWPRSAAANFTARRRAERRTRGAADGGPDGGAAVRAGRGLRDAELAAGVRLPGDEGVAELRAHLVLLVGGVDARHGIPPEHDHRGVDDEQHAGDGEAGSESAGKGSHLRPTYDPLRGCAIPRTGAASGGHHEPQQLDRRRGQDRQRGARGQRDPAVGDQAHEPRGRVDAEPAGAGQERDHGGGPEPAGQHDCRACRGAQARGRRQQQPDVQRRDHEHEQVGVAREGERRAHEQRRMGAEVAARSHGVGVHRAAGARPARRERRRGPGGTRSARATPRHRHLRTAANGCRESRRSHPAAGWRGRRSRGRPRARARAAP